MLKEFIKENLFNKNGKFEGQRLKRAWFEARNFENIWDENEELFSSEELMFIYLRDNNLKEINSKNSQAYPKCKQCGSKTEFLNRVQGYKLHCSEKCHHKTRTETKANKTIEEKQNTLNKRKQTCLEKYGVDAISKVEEFKIKSKETCLEKYGVENVLSLIDRTGDKNPMKRLDVQEKARQTNLEKYGYEYTVQVPEFKEKLKETKLERYGDENFNNQEKSNITCLERYGVKWSFQSENNKEKSKQTWLDKYDMHVSCSEEIKMKTKQTMNAIDENGLTGWDRIRKTNEHRGHWLPRDQWDDFKIYRVAVWKLTNKNVKQLENFVLRGNTKDSYHCDHKYSIFQGFKDSVPVYIIGGIHNLEMIDSRVNMSKNIKCSVTLEELCEMYNI